MGDINKSIHKNVLKAVLYVYYMHMLKFQCNWSNNFLTKHLKLSLPVKMEMGEKCI